MVAVVGTRWSLGVILQSALAHTELPVGRAEAALIEAPARSAWLVGLADSNPIRRLGSTS